MTPQWLLDQELEDTLTVAARQAAKARERRYRKENIPEDDPRWQRLRAACPDESTVDVDEHAANVYLALEDLDGRR